MRRLLGQAAGGPARAEFDLLRADGRVVPVSLSAAPIGGEQGEICLVVMDQTEQHTTETKLRLAEESSRSAFEQAPIGMAVVGLDGRLERVNAAFAAITGRPEVELLGASLLSLLSLLDRTHRTRTRTPPDKLKELRTGEHDWKAREIRYQDAAGRGPGDFLEVAEDAGLITAIGAQVLDQACAMLADRPDLPGPISVNVSAVQLAAPDWLSGVRDTLTAHRVDPARIVIEVTKTAVLSLVDSARVALAPLSGLGVGIHLDDFGTGYSSISVLRDLPVTGVKLDLRFVQDLTEGHSQANALAQGLSGLVNGMHLTGIAEGIETELQADILRAQGWECRQGYYFGRPAAIPVTH